MSSRTEPGSSDLSLLRPDDPRLADAASTWRSAYVHIPFCLRRCPYCDFAIADESVVGRDDVDRYVDAVITEIAMQDPFGPLDAINFGGGTPTRLSPTQLGRIIDALTDRFGLGDDAEISLEANPEDWSIDRAAALVAKGFTRVSIGAQSFDDAVLTALGRVHDASSIEATLRAARNAGFVSVSIDLIFGHPTESDQSWRNSVGRALDLAPDHMSTYSLTVEAGTALADAISAGAPAPDDDVQADRYSTFLELAGAAGLHRYEVSNHARNGHVCRYNLATWANAQYVGFGLGAHDHVSGIRSRNFRTMARYLRSVESGERPRSGHEQLDASESERDRLMLGLRLAAGVPDTGLAGRFADSQAGRRFLEAAVLVRREGRIMVGDPMLTDAVVREALSVSAVDC